MIKSGKKIIKVDPFDDFSKFGQVEGHLLDSGDYESWFLLFLTL